VRIQRPAIHRSPKNQEGRKHEKDAAKQCQRAKAIRSQNSPIPFRAIDRPPPVPSFINDRSPAAKSFFTEQSAMLS
jgi:hypothetical protein